MFKKKELKTLAMVDDDGNVYAVLITVSARKELMITFDNVNQISLTDILDSDFIGNSCTRIYKKIADESETPEKFMYRR